MSGDLTRPVVELDHASTIERAMSEARQAGQLARYARRQAGAPGEPGHHLPPTAETTTAPTEEDTMTTVEQHDQDQPTDAPPYREPRLKTVQRQVRVTPELWAACARKAHAEGTTLGSVIRQMLEEYLES